MRHALKSSLTILSVTLLLGAVAASAAAENRIAAKTPGASAEIRSDGTVRVAVEMRDDEQWLSVHDVGQAGSVDCKGRHVSITGENNKLTLTGECPFLDISGDGNEISVDKLGEASLAGDDNRVTWKQALSGGKPEVSDAGDGNSVKRAPGA